jgi:hypothetical protein
MARRQNVEEGTFKAGRTILPHGQGNVRVELSPDHLDADIELLQLRQPRGVPNELLKELRRQLHERWTGDPYRQILEVVVSPHR